MAIHINNQNAAQINNVEGTQNISGGNQYVTVDQARVAAQALRAALEQLPLPAAAADRLRQDAEAVQRAVSATDPDRGQVAGRLERITRELGRWSALAGAGASLLGPLHTLGRWLGPAGATLLSLLA
jgi:hypothetical protein